MLYISQWYLFLLLSASGYEAAIKWNWRGSSNTNYCAATRGHSEVEWSSGKNETVSSHNYKLHNCRLFRIKFFEVYHPALLTMRLSCLGKVPFPCVSFTVIFILSFSSYTSSLLINNQLFLIMILAPKLQMKITFQKQLGSSTLLQWMQHDLESINT